MAQIIVFENSGFQVYDKSKDDCEFVYYVMSRERDMLIAGFMARVDALRYAKEMNADEDEDVTDFAIDESIPVDVELPVCPECEHAECVCGVMDNAPKGWDFV